MVKIYDMDTYGIREPDDEHSSLDFVAPSTARMAAIPTPELQLIQASPTSPQQALHPVLRYTDVASFLASLD